MELTRDWTRVALDAGPFFRFGETGCLLDLLTFLGTKVVVTREVETELLRNARKNEYAFLRVLQHVQPPLDVVDLSPKNAEELLDRVRAARKPGDHPDAHKGEISTVLLAAEVADVLVICDDPLGKRLAKKKTIARLSTVQLAAELVAGEELSHEEGLAVFNVSAGGADPKHFESAVRQAGAALNV
jgi:hypothetical protein